MSQAAMNLNDLNDDDLLMVTCWACVDCGLYTGNWCEYCKAADRYPKEQWGVGQMTPLCTKCDAKYDQCHFCRGVLWCMPPAHAAS